MVRGMLGPVPQPSPKDRFITVYGRKPVLEALADPALDVDKVIVADNAMYGVYLDGMTILHMGDAGHLPAPEQIRFLADQVDILLALVGGPPTITLDDLDRFIAAVKPRLVIPMHYHNPRGVLSILPVTAYTDRYPAEQVTWRETSEIEVTPDTLPQMMEIVVLQQSR